MDYGGEQIIEDFEIQQVNQKSKLQLLHPRFPCVQMYMSVSFWNGPWCEFLLQVATAKGQQEAALREARKALEDEVHRLWEAMDTHTHDVDVEEDDCMQKLFVFAFGKAAAGFWLVE